MASERKAVAIGSSSCECFHNDDFEFFRILHEPNADLAL